MMGWDKGMQNILKLTNKNGKISASLPNMAKVIPKHFAQHVNHSSMQAA